MSPFPLSPNMFPGSLLDGCGAPGLAVAGVDQDAAVVPDTLVHKRQLAKAAGVLTSVRDTGCKKKQRS